MHLVSSLNRATLHTHVFSWFLTTTTMNSHYTASGTERSHLPDLSLICERSISLAFSQVKTPIGLISSRARSIPVHEVQTRTFTAHAYTVSGIAVPDRAFSSSPAWRHRREISCTFAYALYNKWFKDHRSTLKLYFMS